MKQKDKVLYLFLFVIIAAASLASGLLGNGGGSTLEISSDGHVIKSLALSEMPSGTVIVLREGGGMNELLVSGGSVRMISADCPGGDCLKMQPLSSGRGVIVCLPHKLVIKLKGDQAQKPDGVDAVTY
ncbi:MAG: NusG domain II-containing protein [Synergistaceae bacterium]|jgi:hypothetical protein|nr:NusG domain II-containing protein [Synergistaceae bacterium]